MLDAPFFRKYLLPGFVFQSIVIGGGYGTGRELVEFFLKFGPLGGLLGCKRKIDLIQSEKRFDTEFIVFY